MRRVTGFCLTQDINIITSNDIKPVKLSIDRWQRSLDRQLFFSKFVFKYLYRTLCMYDETRTKDYDETGVNKSIGNTSTSVYVL